MLMLQITSLEHKAFVCVNIYEKQAGGSNTKKKCKHCLSSLHGHVDVIRF